MSNQAEDSYCIFKLNFHELWWNLQLRLRDTKLPALLSHQHSTTVSLETYPLSSPVFNHNNGEIETTMKVLNCQGKNLSLLISFWYHSQGEFRFTTLGVTGKPRLNFSLFHYGLRNVLHNSHHSLKTWYKHTCRQCLWEGQLWTSYCLACGDTMWLIELPRTSWLLHTCWPDINIGTMKAPQASLGLFLTEKNASMYP